MHLSERDADNGDAEYEAVEDVGDHQYPNVFIDKIYSAIAG